LDYYDNVLNELFACDGKSSSHSVPTLPWVTSGGGYDLAVGYQVFAFAPEQEQSLKSLNRMTEKAVNELFDKLKLERSDTIIFTHSFVDRKIDYSGQRYPFRIKFVASKDGLTKPVILETDLLIQGPIQKDSFRCDPNSCFTGPPEEQRIPVSVHRQDGTSVEAESFAVLLGTNIIETGTGYDRDRNRPKDPLLYPFSSPIQLVSIVGGKKMYSVQVLVFGPELTGINARLAELSEEQLIAAARLKSGVLEFSSEMHLDRIDRSGNRYPFRLEMVVSEDGNTKSRITYSNLEIPEQNRTDAAWKEKQ